MARDPFLGYIKLKYENIVTETDSAILITFNLARPKDCWVPKTCLKGLNYDSPNTVYIFSKFAEDKIF